MDAATTSTTPLTLAATAAEGVVSESPVTVRPNLMSQLGTAARLAGLPPTAQARGRTIKTERLTLRPLLASDRAEFLRVLGISRVHLAEFCPLASVEAGATETDEEIFARQLALSDAATGTGRAWRVGMFDADGRLVGAMNINDISRGLENSGEMVFWLSADATRNGYVAEAARATVEFVFADMPQGLGLHRLTGLIAPGNEACRKAAKKIGMSLDPASPPTILTLDGRPVAHDTYHMFASIDESPATSTGADGHVVEGKPSMADELFGRGLLSILRTEAENPPHVAPPPPPPSLGAASA